MEASTPEPEMSIAGILPIHYKFRFTFTEQDKTFDYNDKIPRWRTISQRLLTELLQHYTITHATGGIETLNKCGDRTWCHLHLHFDAIESKDTIRKFIDRFLTKYDQNHHGVKCISLKPEAMLRSKQDFYSYPMKQSFNYKLVYGYTEEEARLLHEIGKSSYLKVQQVNQQKLDKMDNSDTMFERLKTHLGHTTKTSKLDLLIEATKFYVKENKPINRTTVQGYVDTYMLQAELITYEQYWA